MSSIGTLDDPLAQSTRRAHDGALIENSKQDFSVEPNAEQSLQDREAEIRRGIELCRETDKIKYQAAQSDAPKQLTVKEAYEALRNTLDGIGDKDGGQFATSGQLPNAANPGLFVQGIGGIGMPLSERDVHCLAGICHQAPFGKGSETVIDLQVRKTLELNPSQFELQNPAWQQTLNDVVTQVADALGIALGAASMRAELYKLLLYEEGAFFDRHREFVC